MHYNVSIYSGGEDHECDCCHETKPDVVHIRGTNSLPEMLLMILEPLGIKDVNTCFECAFKQFGPLIKLLS